MDLGFFFQDTTYIFYTLKAFVRAFAFFLLTIELNSSSSYYFKVTTKIRNMKAIVTYNFSTFGNLFYFIKICYSEL